MSGILSPKAPSPPGEIQPELLVEVAGGSPIKMGEQVAALILRMMFN